ncbi:MAG: ABC transporter ATP-binding protein [Leucobacter sp.]
MVREFTGSTVRMEGITKRYGDFVAVDNISFDVDAGEFVTLLGASGSGKTTLLRIIAGFLKPDSGRVIIAGKDLTDLPVHKRQIGMVFQNYALFPHMTVEQNVMFPLARQKFPKADRPGMVQDALDAVELGAFAGRKPSELSGGQQQRVALARAIVTRPRVLLMDEPLGALDRRLREALQVEIRRLSSELGITVINVTHDQEEALTMSDRIALLELGHLVQFDAPTAMFESPNSRTSASFLGESNLFSGVAVQSAAGVELSYDDGCVRFPASAAEIESGNEYLVMIRPSRVHVVPVQVDISERHSRINAKVRSVIYAGEYRKLLLQRSDGTEIIARMSALEPFDLKIGDNATMYWDPEDSTIVKGDHEVGSRESLTVT